MSDALKMILVSSGFLAGVVGLLLWVARRIFSGEYYPATWVEQQRQHYNEQIAREQQISDNYRKSAEISVAALDKQREQLDKVLEGQDFVKDFVVALKEAMERDARDRRSLPRGRGQ